MLIPTAYDVDKVVEQLKDSSKTYCEEYHQRENNLYLLDAIEIVKGRWKRCVNLHTDS
nr:MAG TPA: hypothetical protein [Caudoviricetes sp.]